jgi:hypothetical protein
MEHLYLGQTIYCLQRRAAIPLSHRRAWAVALFFSGSGISVLLSFPLFCRWLLDDVAFALRWFYVVQGSRCCVMRASPIFPRVHHGPRMALAMDPCSDIRVQGKLQPGNDRLRRPFCCISLSGYVSYLSPISRGEVLIIECVSPSPSI